MPENSTRYVSKQVMKKLGKEYKSLAKLNIMVLGKTGVGKSTLINSIFEDKLAEVGTGLPVTNDIAMIEQADVPLVLYDTPGMELTGENDYESLLTQVTKIIKDNFEDNIAGNEIHMILYCVSCASHRFEEAESEFLRKITEAVKAYKVPVIVVLTQAFSKEDAARLKQEIEAEELPIASIVPILAEEYEFDEDLIVKPYGMDDLAAVMDEVLPDAVRNTFVALETANIGLKIKKAKVVTNSFTAVAATAAGLSPIPFVDAATLIPKQIGMLVGITMAFGFPVNNTTVPTLINGTWSAIEKEAWGKSLKSSLFKFVPGPGNVVTGAIAGIITEAIGKTYTNVLADVCRGEVKIEEVNTEEYKKKIYDMFMELVNKSLAKRKEKQDG